MPWNTTNSPIDRERIRRILGIPVEKQWLNILDISMTRIQEVSEDAIATIQELLDEHESLKALVSQTLGDSSYALVRADVLEWEAGQRSSGMEIRIQQIKQEIASALLIEPPSSGYSSATLGRS